MTPLERAARRTFHSLRTRNFRLYLIGQIVSSAGSWMQFAAQSWLVLRLTDSGAAVGITIGLLFAPLLIAGAWAGVLIDRLDKRRLLIGTSLASGLVALVLSIVTLVGVVEVWMVYVLAAALGVVTALDNPTRRAFVPELVPGGDVPNAIGLNSSVFTIARIIGPAVGGLVIAGVGVGWCFLINAATFGAVIWSLQAMRADELRTPPPIAHARGQLREGLHYAWDNRPVRIALMLTAIIGTFTFNYQVVLPLLVRRELGGGPETFGMLLAVLACGSFVGALGVAHYGKASLRVTLLTTLVLGAAMTAAALAPTLGTEIAVLPFVGVSSMVMLAMATAVCQEATAPEFRGRVMGLFGVAFLGSTAIGAPIIGALSEALGPRAGLGVGAVAAVAAGLVAFATARQSPAEAAVDVDDVAIAEDPAIALS
ncbi:MAG: MFS transporter [Actinobacteria bacterium]|nr:MFS transporter [Actinomycetota bacterium]